MKTLDIIVRLTAQVPDDVAELVNQDNESVWVDIPLANLTLNHSAAKRVEIIPKVEVTAHNISSTAVVVQAKFVEYETVLADVLDE